MLSRVKLKMNGDELSLWTHKNHPSAAASTLVSVAESNPDNFFIGIAYLTLFPFRFDFACPAIRNSSPFFLGPLVKHSDSGPSFF